MTDLATLAIKIDATQADDAARKLDGLTATGTRAERAMARVTASAGQQRAGMQQLSYQVGDVAQGFAMATQSADPLRMAFMTLGQQGGQVVQALAMMRGEAGGLIGFMAGPWGAGIIAATSVLGPLIARLFDVGGAAADAETALDKMISKYRSAQAEKNKFRDASSEIDEMKSERDRLQVYINKYGYNARGQKQFQYGSQWTRFDELNKKIREAENAMDAERISAWSLDKVMSGLGESAARAGRGHSSHTSAVRGSSSAMSEAKRHADALAKSEEAIAVAAMRSAYAFDQKMRALDGNNSLAHGILGFQPAEIKTVADQIAELNATALEEMAKALGNDAESIARVNAGLSDMVSILGRIGGFGGVLGGLTQGILSDNFSGMGALGGIANVLLNSRDYAKQGDILAEKISKVFNIDGKFGKTLATVLQGASLGSMGAVAILGQGGNNLGSALGGALGQAAGQALTKGMSGILGSLGGPLGAVLGGVLGGLVGGIFGKKPKGGGSVSNTGVSTWANDGAMKAGLDSFGLGIQQSVSKIADQLGGTVGNYSVGIGGYKGGYYQVSRNANDPYLGQSNYKKKSGAAVYDGLDATAALRAAISVAIEQGAIQGVRAGTQTLLKAGTDIEAQLAKALKFQGVFDDLKQATDPIGYALDQITKKFDGLRKIFAEAGATAADYADLEKLLQIQRADAMQQARTDIVNKVQDPLNLQIRIMELLGESEKAVTAQRILELAGLKNSLQPLQAMVYTLEDARAVIDKFTPLRDDLTKFKNELLGGQAGTSFGFLTSQFRSVASAAAGGDATAMGQLRGAANDYLEAAKDNARTVQEYNAARAEVLAATDRAIFAADSQIDYQQAVIDSAKANGAILADMKANLASLSSQIVTTSATVAAILKRWDGGENGAPFQVEVVA